MNSIMTVGLTALQKVYAYTPWSRKFSRPESLRDPDEVSEIIQQKLLDDSPCMIARFGANELATMVNWLGISEHRNRYFSFIKNESPAWWWNQNIISKMHEGAGFFPAETDYLEKFCHLMMEDMPLVDVLGSWLPGEHYFKRELKDAVKVQLLTLDPYWSRIPWTKALAGKKVLIIHPFAETIQKQYKKRELLFKNRLLPEFELLTIRAVQSIAGTKTPFSDWFEALDYMKGKIDETNFDICLIGAGAYGFPLAAHVKRLGKKSFHIGGSLQLLFGIRGKRWEQGYHDVYDYAGLVNQHWVSPGSEEKPANADVVEGGCYW